MDIGFLSSSNEIISGNLDEIISLSGKKSCDTEPENEINEPDMEIGKDDIKDLEVDANSKYDACSDSRDHQGTYIGKSYLEENLPPEDHGYPNSFVNYLYNQLEVKKYDYEFENIINLLELLDLVWLVTG